MQPQHTDTQEMRAVTHATAICPTCGQHSTFRFQGIQTWPEHVAEASGMPTRMAMWTCDNCQTTLLEISVDFD